MNAEIYSSPEIIDQSIQGKYYLGDVLETLRHLIPEYRNQVQLIYMDPPFFTGQDFKFRQPIGTKGWSGDRKHSISHIAYTDKEDRDDFLNMMTEILTLAHKLLTDEGCLYLHIDYRLSAYMRIILDDIFGVDNFLNEIIWHYRTGGRAKRYFSRKHDNILFYRKSKGYYFNIEAVGIPRGADRKNNMKQGKDANGRVFWSIKSNGKEYRYYEDDKVYPSDVWDDIPHLHQQNPERTGYDTQKPEKLLERIILSSSRPGDIVVDFFAGSGTTLSVAQRLGRHWLGIDSSIFSLHTCRKRLLNNKNVINIGFFYNKTIPVLSTMQRNYQELSIYNF
ncbi:MAG: site-specific DNA-methyltransferase [Clostridiales bacterium]|nr:site-specific DNA-methyltransferase [Clostridiales bacterium]